MKGHAMKTLVTRLALSAAVLGVWVSVSIAEDKIDNPEYQRWAAFEPGASVTMRIVAESQGGKTEMIQTTKLTSKTAAEATVETATEMQAGGKTMTLPPQTRVIPAKMDKPPEPADPAAKPKVTQGSDELTIAGKTLQCQWIETTMVVGGQTAVTKVWQSDQVPGGQVKMVSRIDGPNGSATTTMELTAFTTGS